MILHAYRVINEYNPCFGIFFILQCLEINALENIFQSGTHESDAVFKLLN